MNARRARGFNLIELMIVVAIVAILTIVALPSFSGMLQNSNTRSAADSIENGIRFAQGEAVRLNRITTFTPTSTGNWTVTYTQISPPDPTTTGSNVLQTQPSTYSSTLSVSPTTAISFNGLGRAGTGSTFSATTGTTTFTPAAADLTYQIRNSSSSVLRKLNVTVSPSGRIRMCDPDKSFNATTTPDGC